MGVSKVLDPLSMELICTKNKDSYVPTFECSRKSEVSCGIKVHKFPLTHFLLCTNTSRNVFGWYWQAPHTTAEVFSKTNPESHTPYALGDPEAQYKSCPKVNAKHLDHQDHQPLLLP